MTTTDACQDVEALVEVSRVLFSMTVMGLPGHGAFSHWGREYFDTDADYEKSQRQKEALRKHWEETGQALSPAVEEIIALVNLQFRHYDPQRQPRLTTLRKQVWMSEKPGDEVQVVLFLSEVPRIFHKTHGVPREAGTFFGSRGEYERDGKPYAIRNRDRAKGIANCLRKAERAAKLEEPIGFTLERAAARAAAEGEVLFATA